MRETPIRRRARRAAAGAALCLTSGCVLSDTPAVAACRTGAIPSMGPSSGALRVIPSAFRGVEIDSATWATWASTEDLGAHQGVDYFVRLHATRPVRSDDFALLYETTGRDGAPTMQSDVFLWGGVGNPYREAAGRDSVLATPGRPLDVVTSISLGHGIATGLRSKLAGCPAAVRVVPRADLALYLQPGTHAGDAREVLLQQLPTGEAGGSDGPLRVVGLTTARDQWGDAGIISGQVVNTTDTALTETVVALVTDAPAETRYPPMHPALRDTLEYLVPRIGPREVVGFAGGFFEHGERVSARVSYPAASVRGRPVADDKHQHRASRLPRIDSIAIAGGRSWLTVDAPAILQARALDSGAKEIGEYRHAPRRWTLGSTETPASISPDTGERVTVRARRDGQVQVRVTMMGVTARTELNFQWLQGEEMKSQLRGRTELWNGTIIYEHVCTVHRDGRTEHPEWAPAFAAELRAKPPAATAQEDSSRRRTLEALARCKL